MIDFINLSISKSMSSPFTYCFLGYLSTSILLFIFPTIIRKKTRVPAFLGEALRGEKMLRIAHRGGPRLSAENTIQGFKKVVHCVDMLQMDVCETKDKVLVVHHDKSLKRCCGVDKNVEDFNFQDLPRLKDEITIDFADNMKMKTNNQRIPKLEEVFKVFQGVPMNIQLKTPTDSAIKEFVRLLREYDRIENTVVGIRNHKIKDLEQLCPEIPIFMGAKPALRLLLLYYTGLLPFFKVENQTFQFPMYTTDFKKRKLQEYSSLEHRIKVNIAMGFLVFLNWTIRPLVWHLKKRGITPMAWVCNTQEEFERAIKLGACGIMTDDPFSLDKYIQKRQIN